MTENKQDLASTETPKIIAIIEAIIVTICLIYIPYKIAIINYDDTKIIQFLFILFAIFVITPTTTAISECKTKTYINLLMNFSFFIVIFTAILVYTTSKILNPQETEIVIPYLADYNETTICPEDMKIGDCDYAYETYKRPPVIFYFNEDQSINAIKRHNEKIIEEKTEIEDNTKKKENKEKEFKEKINKAMENIK